MILLLAQVAATEPVGWAQRALGFIDTPAPFSPFTEYLFVLFVLWLIARRANRKRESFDTKAQEVLDSKYEEGELSREAYDKYRQDVTLRPKR
jgi:hypothetical protein